MPTQNKSSNEHSAPSVSYERGDDEPYSIAVVRAIAACRNTTPLELDPLYDVIDLRSLDSIFENASESTRQSYSFAFSYDGYEVTVTHAEISVRETNGETT